MHPRRQRRRWRKLGFVGAIVLLLGLTLELGSRLALPFVAGSGVGVSEVARQRRLAAGNSASPEARARRQTKGAVLHPYLGFVLNPTLSQGKEFVAVHGLPISPFGFIDDKVPLQRRQPGRKIVGITGGSVAYFFSVGGIETLARDLARLPGWEQDELIFVRLALGGFKQPQQLLAVQYLLALGGEFDLIVNLDGFNEIALYPAEQPDREVFYAFPRGWPLLAAKTVSREASTLQGKAAFFRGLEPRWAEALALPGSAWLAFPNLVWLTGQRVLERHAADAEFVLARLPPDSFATSGPSSDLASEEEAREALAQLWHNSSIQLHRLCAANGIRYFHFLQPNLYAEHGKAWSSEELTVFDPASPYGVAASRGYGLLRHYGVALTAEGVAFTDLTHVFDSERESIYLDSCCHVNDRGNELMAQAIGEAIVTAFERVADRQRSIPAP